MITASKSHFVIDRLSMAVVITNCTLLLGFYAYSYVEFFAR
jgi:hypothetical protein